jgi:hypothetical protein
MNVESAPHLVSSSPLIPPLALLVFLHGDMKRHIMHFLTRSEVVALVRACSTLQKEVMQTKDWPLEMHSLRQWTIGDFWSRTAHYQRAHIRQIDLNVEGLKSFVIIRSLLGNFTDLQSLRLQPVLAGTSSGAELGRSLPLLQRLELRSESILKEITSPMRQLTWLHVDRHDTRCLLALDPSFFPALEHLDLRLLYRPDSADAPADNEYNQRPRVAGEPLPSRGHHHQSISCDPSCRRRRCSDAAAVHRTLSSCI